MALISGASRVEFRRGLYATRSITQPYTPVTMTVKTRVPNISSGKDSTPKYANRARLIAAR